MAKKRAVALDDASLFINRELSMLAFHRRVLDRANDSDTPLLEKVRFLAISSSILDEFFEIRVGGLKEQVAFGLAQAGPDGLGPQETLGLIRTEVLELVAGQYRLLNSSILPELEANGIAIYRSDRIDERLRAWVSEYFTREVLPVLTPVGLDPSHPFPRILNKSLNYIVALGGRDAFGRRSNLAVIQAPRILPRLIPLPKVLTDVPYGFVLLTDVIHQNVGQLFPGMKIRECDQFRVTRNSDLWVDEEETQDLLLALKGELPRRHYGSTVRLEVSDTCPPDTATFMLNQFELSDADLYRVEGPVNLNRLGTLYDLVDRPSLKYPTFIPGLPNQLSEATPIFRYLQDRDILLHHPYQSFAPVVNFVRQAAEDPEVLAIKMTVYRTGADSPLMETLIDAARAGKEVTVVVELRARFDEAANIELAARLQEAGAKVVYGIVGFKTHAKMILVVRREGTALRRYVHLGTGNYNSRTARSYSDFGLFTADPLYGEDVQELFQELTGFGHGRVLRRIIQTPFELHRTLIELIRREAENHKAGKKARVAVKTNAITEPEIIRALYEASRAGVPIDLVVRGICCLRPGVAGVSETIRVRSIVGRFLEHHRVFHFHANGEGVTLCSSADWMQRNFFRRVEASFPVPRKADRERVVREGIDIYFEDTRDAWEMRADGSYRRRSAGDKDKDKDVSAQRKLLEQLALR